MKTFEKIKKYNMLKANEIVLQIMRKRLGCNSKHNVGDKFYLDYAANEMIFAGMDPNSIRLNERVVLM